MPVIEGPLRVGEWKLKDGRTGSWDDFQREAKSQKAYQSGLLVGRWLALEQRRKKERTDPVWGFQYPDLETVPKDSPSPNFSVAPKSPTPRTIRFPSVEEQSKKPATPGKIMGHGVPRSAIGTLLLNLILPWRWF